MRKLALTLSLSTMLGLAGAAAAALPVAGDFAGTTSVHSINGFQDPVTFVSVDGGRTLKQFQFSTLGCMGTGSFPVGVDPWVTGSALGTVASVPVSAKGAILLTARPYFSETDGIVTTVRITGSFTSARAVEGTISVSQSEHGSKCGPTTMKFSAAPGTP